MGQMSLRVLTNNYASPKISILFMDLVNNSYARLQIICLTSEVIMFTGPEIKLNRLKCTLLSHQTHKYSFLLKDNDTQQKQRL